MCLSLVMKQGFLKGRVQAWRILYLSQSLLNLSVQYGNLAAQLCSPIRLLFHQSSTTVGSIQFVDVYC
jgi:hypothetical protein